MVFKSNTLISISEAMGGGRLGDGTAPSGHRLHICCVRLGGLYNLSHEQQTTKIPDIDKQMAA